VPGNTLQKNAEKMGGDFVLGAASSNCINCLLESTAVPDANILFTIFPVAGSITVGLVVFSGFH
jgi:hypothetical protein